MALVLNTSYRAIIKQTDIDSMSNGTQHVYVDKFLGLYTYQDSEDNLLGNSYIDVDEILIIKSETTFEITLLNNGINVRRFGYNDFVVGTNKKNIDLVITFTFTGEIGDDLLPNYLDVSHSNDKFGVYIAIGSGSTYSDNIGNTTTSTSMQPISESLSEITFTPNGTHKFFNGDFLVQVQYTYKKKNNVNQKFDISSHCLIDVSTNKCYLPFLLPFQHDNEVNCAVGSIYLNAHLLTIQSISASYVSNFKINGDVTYSESVNTGDDSTILELTPKTDYRFTEETIEKLKNIFANYNVDINLTSYYLIKLQFIEVISDIEIGDYTRSELAMVGNPVVNISHDATTQITSQTSPIHYDEEYEVQIDAVNTATKSAFAPNVVYGNRGTTKFTTYTENGFKVKVPKLTANLSITIPSAYNKVAFILNGTSTDGVYKSLGVIPDKVGALVTYDDALYKVKLQVFENNTNNIFFSLQVPVVVPVLKQVGGIGFEDKDGNITPIKLIVGERVNDFNIKEYIISSVASTNVFMYPVMVDEYVTPNEFKVHLFKNSSELNVVDKTSFLENVATLNGTLRESCSMISPIVTIEYGTAQQPIPNFNYVYIVNFKRFYFVREITNVRNNLWNISLEIDVLMSHREQIKKQVGIIARNENEYDKRIEDNQVVKKSGNDIEVEDIAFDTLHYPFTDYGAGSPQTDEPYYQPYIVVETIRGVYRAKSK